MRDKFARLRQIVSTKNPGLHVWSSVSDLWCLLFVYDLVSGRTWLLNQHRNSEINATRYLHYAVYCIAILSIRHYLYAAGVLHHSVVPQQFSADKIECIVFSTFPETFFLSPAIHAVDVLHYQNALCDDRPTFVTFNPHNRAIISTCRHHLKSFRRIRPVIGLEKATSVACIIIHHHHHRLPPHSVHYSCLYRSSLSTYTSLLASIYTFEAQNAYLLIMSSHLSSLFISFIIALFALRSSDRVQLTYLLTHQHSLSLHGSCLFALCLDRFRVLFL